MPSSRKMLIPLFAALLQVSSVMTAPTGPSTLSIPTKDIVKNDLSAHEAHQNFDIYKRWLETPQGSYIKRDPEAAFSKHSNVASIDCHSDLGTCLLKSRLAFADITKSPRELADLNQAIEDQLQVRHEEDARPETLFSRSLQKRAQAKNLLSSNHLKTYHDLGEENPSAGFQHYITWNLKCQTVELSSSGFQLTSNQVNQDASNKITATLSATLIGDEDPDSTHSVTIGISFGCGVFVNKCCVQTHWTQNYIGGSQVVTPHDEPIECFKGEDVSNFNCDSYHGGWCTMHITQYQKNQGPGIGTENYRFDVTLFDGDKEIVAETELLSIPSGQTKQVGSTLPYTFGVTAPNVDGDAVYMSYNGMSWGSNDQEHQCDFGGFDSGHRDGDCGFTC